MDQRYAPPSWQTSICLPDDWQKTLVHKDGGLLYDYPGKFAGFATKVTAGLENQTTWAKQELLTPRVPIVRTFKRSGDIEFLEESFAVAPVLPPAKVTTPAFPLERVGSQTGQAGWAKPPRKCDPAFADVAIGWAQAVQYHFKAAANERYTVVLGLCEGWHTNAGQRVMDLQIEGKTRQTVDLFADKGRNVPALYPFEAQDENGDGWIDIAVSPAANARDKNTILNLLWVFRGTNLPAMDALLAGQSPVPALAHLHCGAGTAANNPPRHDLLVLHLKNTGTEPAKATPALTVESESAINTQQDSTRVLIGNGTTLDCSQNFTRAETWNQKLTLHFAETNLPAGKEHVLVFVVARGQNAAELKADMRTAESLRKKAERFWEKSDLPYRHLQVPDAGVQALVDSSIRNIFQAREIKKGLPAFQVGPTCYRGLWVVDGSFLLEAMTYLGRAEDTRNGVKYLMSFQREDGAFLLMDGHWKETGIALWAITRHARLTGDKNWLREAWSKVEKGYGFIGKMRTMPLADAPNAGLIPDGFSDGGLADRVPEYTNIYWTMAGMRAAIEAARWLGLDGEADDWQRQYDDFEKTFRRAAARDMQTDKSGNQYLPIRMKKGEGIPQQKAQWAFMHAIFPGKVFTADDPLVRGNMAMLRAVESQGLIFDTGWLKDGIWTYFGSFYGHSWLWLGEGEKAARTLYAFGNHASPLLVWREEQKPVGQGDQVVGDMPHNWASAEFIRLVRHSLVLERGQELHLFEAFPAKWAAPGAITRVNEVLTEFGPISFEFKVAKDGKTGTLHLNPPKRTSPQKIIWHLDNWSGQQGTLELPVKGRISKRINLG